MLRDHIPGHMVFGLHTDFPEMCFWQVGIWKCGIVELQKCGNVGCGNVELWKCGNVEMWIWQVISGNVELWKCRNVEMWDVEMWNCGNVEMWKCGMWKCGNVEIWKSGNVAATQGAPNASDNATLM